MAETYRVSLERFEGPLDLLLHLIQQAEIDIKDIFVSEITSQYLTYMRELDTLDMDTASEFLTMAATLLYIKSRRLLPRPPKETPEEEAEEDPEELLIRQLRDYKAFKEASAALQTRFEEARDSLTRLPEDVPLPPQKIDLDGTTMDNLYAAFLAILDRTEKAEATERLHRVRPDSYTIRGQLKKIRSKLFSTDAPVRFETLFGDAPEKMEIIVTFMALLEMIAHGEIGLKQPSPFAPILVQRKKLFEGGEDAAFSYMDELPEGEE